MTLDLLSAPTEADLATMASFVFCVGPGSIEAAQAFLDVADLYVSRTKSMLPMSVRSQLKEHRRVYSLLNHQLLPVCDLTRAFRVFLRVNIYIEG